MVKSETRKHYERCYRAWRKNSTYEVMDCWRNRLAIYRAAGDSYVGSATDFSGWLHYQNFMKFAIRRMDIREARNAK